METSFLFYQTVYTIRMQYTYTHNMQAKPMYQNNRSSHSIPRSLAHKLANRLVLRPESDRDLSIVNNCGIVPIATNSKPASQYSRYNFLLQLNWHVGNTC